MMRALCGETRNEANDYYDQYGIRGSQHLQHAKALRSINGTLEQRRTFWQRQLWVGSVPAKLDC